MFLADIFGAMLLVSMVAGGDVDCGDDPAPNGPNVGNVAFTAVLHEDITPVTSQIIVYPVVLTNVGDGYNTTTGIFTAPTEGIYVFHIHGLNQKTKDFWLDLYKNGQYLISAFGRDGSDYVAGGNSVVVKLINGDRVYVKNHRTAYLYGRSYDTYTTFSGYKI